jgi:hypothetical protein
MARPCSICQSAHVKEVDRRLKAAQPATDVVLFLASVGLDVHRTSVGRHARHALGSVIRPRGPRPVGASFLGAVVDTAWANIEDGTAHVSTGDGIKAASELARQQDRGQDRDLIAKITIALTGGSNLPRIVGPEVDALEAEFRQLLPGDASATDLGAMTAEMQEQKRLRERG